MKRIVDFETNSSHQSVKQFFKFLQKGGIPDLPEDQNKVFQLLKEWDCHFLVLISFLFLTSCHSKDLPFELMPNNMETEKMEENYSR